MRRCGGTYVYIAFDITNQEEVAGAGVADVGVHGDGTARVSVNEIRELRWITRGGERAVSPGIVDETNKR